MTKRISTGPKAALGGNMPVVAKLNPPERLRAATPTAVPARAREVTPLGAAARDEVQPLPRPTRTTWLRQWVADLRVAG